MNIETRLKIKIVVHIGLFFLLLCLDRVTKGLAAEHLKGQPDVRVIHDDVVLHYLENTGAAFGIFQNSPWIFYVITGVVLVLLLVFYIKIQRESFRYVDKTDRQNGTKDKTISQMNLLCIGLMVLAAGAVGNLIDRILYGYVIDFIDVRFIGFPVFNIADIYVTISCIFIAIFFIFAYKKNENFNLL